jgi:two-component system LytT family response regulator
MEKIITALIVDDELASREMLVSVLQDQFPEIDILGSIGKPEEVILFLAEHKPDIVFLDVQMPNYNGFELLDSIPNLESQVVFISAFQEFALRAFRYNAIDFLLKPLKLEELREAIRKAIYNKKEKLNKHLDRYDKIAQPNSIEANVAKIAIKSNDKIVILHEFEIVYLKANGNYTEFYCTLNRKYFATKNLKEFEGLLNVNNFLRVHHTYLVNTSLPFIYDTITNEVVYENEIRVPVSVRKKKALLERYLMGAKK